MINERLIVEDYSSRRYYSLTLVVAILMIVSIVVTWRFLPSQVPLFFTYPWGDGRLADKTLLFLLPGLVILFTICNFVIGKVLKYYPIILTRIMSIISLVISVMLLLSLIGIVHSVI